MNGSHLSLPKAPHTLQMRAGVKMGDAALQDSMVADGLTDAFHGYHMGITGEDSQNNALNTELSVWTMMSYGFPFICSNELQPAIRSCH